MRRIKSTFNNYSPQEENNGDKMTDSTSVNEEMPDNMRILLLKREEDYADGVENPPGKYQPETGRLGSGREEGETGHNRPTHRQI